MASTTYHAQLIKYDSSGNQSILNLKNTGDDVSISRNSNGNLPSTVTSAQTLANAFGSLAFKSAVAWSDVSGLASTELTVSSAGKLADARAIKALNDKIATNASNITKLNSNLEDKANKYNEYLITLKSSEWTSSSDIEYAMYTISNVKITAKSDICITLSNTNNSDATIDWINAAITAGDQSTGNIQLHANGTKPIHDIIIKMLIGSDTVSS